MAELLPELIEEVVSAPERGEQDNVVALVAAQDTDDVALLLESLPLEQRLKVWEGIPKRRRLDVLVAMRGDPRETLISATDISEWEAIFFEVDAEQLLELSDSLPNALVDKALDAMDKQQRQYFTDASQFSDDEIGHWLSQDPLVLPLNAKVRDALRLIRRDVPTHADTIFLVNRAGQFSEAVKLTNVMGLPEHVPLVDLSEEVFDTINASDELTTASLMVQRSGFASLPVVDEQSKVLGR